jgi:hypothetical protein
LIEDCWFSIGSSLNQQSTILHGGRQIALMAKATGSAPLRRSSRVYIRIPVTITGTLPDGKPFDEETYLLSVSKFGAKLKTLLPLQRGMQLKVIPKNRHESGLFRVVWMGQAGTPRAGEVGIEYVNVSNLLGISFPE